MAIDPNLEKVVNYLVSTEDSIGDGVFGGTGRPWLNFSSLMEVGKFNFAGLHTLFNRDASNDAYATARTQRDSVGKTIQTAKLSADYLAGLERDYRMRTRSRVRMFTHLGNRAKVNGMTSGPLRVNTIDWFSRILAEDQA